MPISKVPATLQQPSHPIVTFVLFNLAESSFSGSHPLSARHDPNISSSSALPVRRQSIITPGAEKNGYYYVVLSKRTFVCVLVQTTYTFLLFSWALWSNLDVRKSIVCNFPQWWPSGVLFSPWLPQVSMRNHYNRPLFLYLHCQGLLQLYCISPATLRYCTIGSVDDHQSSDAALHLDT